MSVNSYEIRECQNPDCGLRYPLTDLDTFGSRCPACLGTTRIILRREMLPAYSPAGAKTKPRLSALLDNVRSAWNVGSIFRTADGLGLNKLYLCGITPTPDNKSVRKTSLGAEEQVAWEHSLNAVETAKKLKIEGHRLIALEQDIRAVPITQLPIFNPQTTTLILGNEVTGVDPDLLDLCDHIIYIPMRGEKRSFNVEVAFAIATFALTKD